MSYQELDRADNNDPAVKNKKHCLSSSERYRLLVEQTHEYAMLSMDVDGRIESWNKGAERILGYKESEAVGKSGRLIFTPSDLEAGKFEEELREARKTGQAEDERWHLRKDGSLFWGSGVVVPLKDEGQLVGYAKVMRDNTERKKIEAWLLESRAKLASDLVSAEQRERKRVAQILHDDLQQQLYALQVQLQLLQENVGVEGEEWESKSALKESLAELEKLVVGSLELTRSLTAELSPPLAKGTGMQLTFEWLGEHMADTYGLQVTVKGDDSANEMDHNLQLLLFQVVRELLFNVVKHAQVKEAVITIDRQEDGVTVTVSDEGEGFDVEAVMAQEKGGFGLHSVVERLSLFGRGADIQSTPGEGTKISLFMPFTV